MTPTQLSDWRAKIAADTEQYLENGGTITRIIDGVPVKDPLESWIPTIEAAKLLGITHQKLLKWKATNSPDCPKCMKRGAHVLWYVPSLQAFKEQFKGGRAA